MKDRERSDWESARSIDFRIFRVIRILATGASSTLQSKLWGQQQSGSCSSPGSVCRLPLRQNIIIHLHKRIQPVYRI